jgi:hypothetical protein
MAPAPNRARFAFAMCCEFYQHFCASPPFSAAVRQAAPFGGFFSEKAIEKAKQANAFESEVTDGVKK